jgi:hypothetical protein
MEFVDRADARLEPIPLERCRQLLGEEAETLTDEEVALIRRHAETMAYIVTTSTVHDRPETVCGHRPALWATSLSATFAVRPV